MKTEHEHRGQMIAASMAREARSEHEANMALQPKPYEDVWGYHPDDPGINQGRNVHHDPDGNLRAARGIITTVVIGLALWAAIALVVLS